MKLERLTSTTRSISRDAAERARSAASEDHRRVNAGEGVEGDRERSLQQELAAAASKIAMVATGGEAQEEAREVAEQLLKLGDEAAHLLRPVAASSHSPAVDTEA